MRRLSTMPFPSYAFIPGKNPHPRKAGGHSEGQHEPVTTVIEKPQQHELFRYGIDLFNHGYPWESHVYFEAIWNAHGRTGQTADFLKALIKIGAAAIKFETDQPKFALEHLERAEELLVGDEYLGFDLVDLKKQIRRSIEEKKMSVELVPKWAAEAAH